MNPATLQLSRAIGELCDAQAGDLATAAAVAIDAQIQFLVSGIRETVSDVKADLFLLKALMQQSNGIANDISPEAIESAFLELAIIAHSLPMYLHDAESEAMIGSPCTICMQPIVDVIRPAPGQPRILICVNDHRTIRVKEAAV